MSFDSYDFLSGVVLVFQRSESKVQPHNLELGAYLLDTTNLVVKYFLNSLGNKKIGKCLCLCVLL